MSWLPLVARLLLALCMIGIGAAGHVQPAPPRPDLPRPDLPRIAFVSIHIAEMPTIAKAGARRVADDVTVDFFGLGGGLVPSIEGVDLGRYDLVLLDAAGPRLLNFTRQIEDAKMRTKVLVVGPGTPIAGTIDPAAHPDIARYWTNATEANFAGLFAYAAARVLGRSMAVPPPVDFPPLALWHPDAPAPFAAMADYLGWASARFADAGARPKVGILFYRSLVLANNAGLVTALVREIERQGGMPVPIWREGGGDLASTLLGDTRLDALILCGNRIDYASAQAGVAEAERLGVPPLMCATDYRGDADAWRSSLGGFAPASTGELAMSELDGIVEPMILAARATAPDGTASYDPIADQIRWRVARALAWANLRRLPNADKHVVVSYHNEEPGEADVGSDPDSYLDAQGSMVALLERLRAEGYDTGAAPLPDRATLARRLATEATNAAQGDDEALRRRIAQGAIAVPVRTYLAWYAALPAALKQEVERVWGPPPGKLMTVDGQVVVPALQFGKVILAAHPLWGPQTGGKALEQRGALPPHHQYLAFYLWMQKSGRADAYLPLFTQLSLMPGKQEGPAATDAVGLLIGALPHIQPQPLQANGGVGNKRRTQAVTIGFMPQFVRAGLSPPLAEMKAMLDADPVDEAALRRAVAAAGLAASLGLDPASAPFDALRAGLATYLAEAEAAPIPLGGHILGQAPASDVAARMVQAMLAVGQPAPHLEDVARALGGEDDVLDAENTHRARDYAARIASAPREMDAIIAALAGGYVPPGPMQDAIRNPDALPAGRNPYTLDVRAVPTPQAWDRGVTLADEMLADYRAKHGRLPRKVAFVLWSSETAQNGGTNEAQILHLLGVRPIRDARGHVVDIALVDRAALGRARVDVLVTTSGTYRDHFGEKLALIARAIRLAAQAEEADNPVRAETQARARALQAQGVVPETAEKRALRRIFSTAPGAYSPSTQFANREGWSKAKLDELYRARMGHAYGDGDDGEPDSTAFTASLGTVDAAVFSRSSSAYGLLDTPMPAAYLGGLSMAVQQETGRTIEGYIANEQASGQPHVETVDRFYARERDSRYLNPAWIKAMQASGYNGARYMADLTDSMSLWEQTRPDLVSDRDWEAVRDVYLHDRYRLGMDRYFAEHNPAARQKLVRTMLDAIDRGDWKADDATRAELQRTSNVRPPTSGREIAPVTRSESPASRGPITAQNQVPSAARAPQAPLVSGYELEPAKSNAPIQPPARRTMLATTITAVLVALLLIGGAALRPRW
ncbi:cobaltochelatase [Sphingobium sp. SYK-6]|uniref:cobaltochelatase subunit CobN n=1 Tax=Sphingobium sp. (strain NBRC 103272 / SYK-6) TaxID=627192 RepID=UPI00022766FC|nr:cobaltochelatase subunit CobN [Sphingobium sp. SYK-6]BAK65757.1 cobaltochelatase [Sphingobium sp. SYK-6]